MVLRADKIFLIVFLGGESTPRTLVYVSCYYFLNIVLFDYIWLQASCMDYIE